MPRTSYQTEAHQLDIGPLGHIEGLKLSTNGKPAIYYYGGIPYALPPVGPYRFRKARQLPPCYRYGHRASPGRFSGGTAVCPQPAFRGKPDDSLFDENCLQLNIYIPAGEAPQGGWPVFFYIHGGYLQWGDPNMPPHGLAPLLSETSFRCIIVEPAYRLNAFGFLVSKELQAEAEKNREPAGNMGFWDQRMALEWTWKNITLFGGNQDQITVGGYSAGSHSTFQQLAHELYRVPDNKAIIKNAIMWSNSPGVQPKSLAEHQKQFDEYTTALEIESSLTGEEKLRKLRAIPDKHLVPVQDKMKLSEFRAYSDGAFIPTDIIANINNGDFAKRMKRRGIKLMNGETKEEHNSYRHWRTPSQSYLAVYTRLCADYPEAAVSKLMHHYCQGKQDLPKGYSDWQHLFGHVYSDMQVHCLERGFQNALVKGGLVPGRDLLRYRIEKRMKCIDSAIPPQWGVTHATDMAMWFYGLNYGDGLTEDEKRATKPLIEAFAAFVKGEEVQWGTTGLTQAKRLRGDGKTEIWDDEMWEKGLEVWKLVNGDGGSIKARI